MIDDPAIERISRFLDVNAQRLQLISSNIANLDTPGYRTRDLNFQQELDRAQGGFEFAQFAPAVRQVSGLLQRPDGNNVSMERESLLLAETQLRFNAGIELLRDQFKNLQSAIHEGSAS